MHTLLRPATFILLALLSSIHTLSQAMEEQKSLVAKATESIDGTLESAVFKHIEDTHSLEDIVKTIATSTAQLPLDALRHAQEIIDQMIDKIDETAGWPKLITLKYDIFHATSDNDQNSVVEALKTLKQYEYDDEHQSKALNETTVFSPKRIFKIENMQAFITFLQALKTLKDYIFLADEGVICSICRESCTTPNNFAVDKSKINKDVLFRLSCNHTYHMACLIGWLRKNNTCPYCTNPFQLTSTHIEGLERGPTVSEIEALNALNRNKRQPQGFFARATQTVIANPIRVIYIVGLIVCLVGMGFVIYMKMHDAHRKKQLLEELLQSGRITHLPDGRFIIHDSDDYEKIKNL